jgi:hypothetical protein
MAALIQQGLVIALFYDFPFAQDDDPVGVADSR